MDHKSTFISEMHPRQKFSDEEVWLTYKQYTSENRLITYIFLFCFVTDIIKTLNLVFGEGIARFLEYQEKHDQFMSFFHIFSH